MAGGSSDNIPRESGAGAQEQAGAGVPVSASAWIIRTLRGGYRHKVRLFAGGIHSIGMPFSEGEK